MIHIKNMLMLMLIPIVTALVCWAIWVNVTL